MSNRYSVVMIREGTFRGQSPSVPLRFSRAVIADGAKTMLGKPVRIANPKGLHEDDAQLVAGRVVSSKFEHDALTGVIELDPKAPGYAIAKPLLDATLAIGGIQNVSIDGAYVADVKPGLHDVASIAFTALTLVPRGACNDLHGCGVTAALSQGVSTMDTTNTNAVPIVPVTTGTTATNTTAGTVTFTVAPEAAEPAKTEAHPCGCKDAEAKLAALPTLEAKLAESTKATESLKAELAAAMKTNETLKQSVPLIVELATLLPDFKTDGLGVGELKAALAAAKLAPKAEGGAVRKSLLAEPTPTPMTPKERLSAQVDRYFKR